MTPKKVLIAEDDEDDQTLFYYYLQNRKDIVLLPMTENGVELIEALTRITNTDDLPDLIILDQNMPKKNGLQTLQFLKSRSTYKKIPVMVCSTYLDQSLINSCTTCGASAVITKPVTQEGYNDMINTFLGAIGS